jgi:hypothetical protein
MPGAVDSRVCEGFRMPAHEGAPVLSEGCEPLISGQDVPSRYRLGRVVRRSTLPRERFSPLAHLGHEAVAQRCPFIGAK